MQWLLKKIIGTKNERDVKNMRPLVARSCDVLAAIPLKAPVESLNVSVAAAIFLFEARRQRAAGAAGTSASDR